MNCCVCVCVCVWSLEIFTSESMACRKILMDDSMSSVFGKMEQ